MKNLTVSLKNSEYNICFKNDFSGLVNLLKMINAPQKLLVVTDSNVVKLYCKEVTDLLEISGYCISVFYFEAGEKSKNMDTILAICKACSDFGLDRGSMILALGGGVVGDMAGFAASVYMRGIDYVSIPTTLLSQSDSSVGGKTGIDFLGAKNIIGTFHQPKAVYINTGVLSTLPEREFVSGMGEVIKHAVIRDENFFSYLYNNCEEIKNKKNDLLLDMSYKNCSIKARVVENDEFEHGLRSDLNFGHTIGHALESYFGFSKSHGECVALGMIASSYIANRRDKSKIGILCEIENILNMYGFCCRAKIDDIKRVVEIMKKDKKIRNGEMKFILPVKIGEVYSVYDVAEDEIIQALGYIGNYESERGKI